MARRRTRLIIKQQLSRNQEHMRKMERGRVYNQTNFMIKIPCSFVNMKSFVKYMCSFLFFRLCWVWEIHFWITLLKGMRDYGKIAGCCGTTTVDSSSKMKGKRKYLRRVLQFSIKNLMLFSPRVQHPIFKTQMELSSNI